MNTNGLIDEFLFRALGRSGVHARLRGALLKTGQTTQYAGMLDDGYYQKGIAKAYQILTTGQYSGSVNITLNGKTDAHSNNCVLDLNTGMMWSRFAVASIGPSSNGTLPWTTNGSGEGIFPFVAQANAVLLAGYSDWRIPGIYALASLCDMEAPTAAPDAVAFPGFSTSTRYYSSTTTPSAVTNALSQSFATGASNSDAKTGNLLCLLVRG